MTHTIDPAFVPPVEPHAHLAALRLETARVGHLARTTDHGAPLPHLPGWTVGDAIAHLVGDYRWATDIVTTRRMSGGFAGVDETGDALIDALDEATDRMIAAVELALGDLDAPCPNFAERDAGTLRFWPRRQSQETTMHRWDLEVPGGEHAPIGAALAADGIDELLHNYTRRYGGQRLSRRLVLRCTDRPEAWRITPATIGGDATRVVVDRCAGTTAADVEAPAASLLLAMSHRLTPDEAVLGWPSGDPDAETAARTFLAGPLTA